MSKLNILVAFLLVAAVVVSIYFATKSPSSNPSSCSTKCGSSKLGDDPCPTKCCSKNTDCTTNYICSNNTCVVDPNLNTLFTAAQTTAATFNNTYLVYLSNFVNSSYNYDITDLLLVSANNGVSITTAPSSITDPFFEALTKGISILNPTQTPPAPVFPYCSAIASLKITSSPSEMLNATNQAGTIITTLSNMTNAFDSLTGPMEDYINYIMPFLPSGVLSKYPKIQTTLNIVNNDLIENNTAYSVLLTLATSALSASNALASALPS